MNEMSLSSKFFLNVIRSDFDSSLVDVDYNELDWNEVFQLAKNHRIFPRFYKAVKEAIPDAYKNMYSVQNQYYRNKVDSMLADLKHLQAISKTDKVRFLLIKGLPLSMAIYNDVYARQVNDIDILVAEDDVYRMNYSLRKDGYVQPFKCDWKGGQFSLLPFTIPHLKHSKHQYEYFKFGENMSKMEVHTYLPYFKPFMSEVLWSTTGVVIDDCVYNTLDLEHMCLYLFINAYNASETYDALQRKALLRDYIDIYECLKKYISEIDWEKFYHLNVKYGFGLKYNLMLENMRCLYPNNPIIAKIMEIDKKHSSTSESASCYIEMDFVSRMLLPEQRKATAVAALKERVYTSQKMSDPIIVYPYEHQCSTDEMDVYECDMNITIKYGLNYTKEGLYVTLEMDEQLYRDIDKYMISFTLLNNDPDNPYLYNRFEVTVTDHQVQILKKDYKYHCSAYIFDRNDGEMKLTGELDTIENRIEFFVPFAAIGSEPFGGKCNFAGQVDLYKNIYKSLYHLVNNMPRDVFEARVLQFIE